MNTFLNKNIIITGASSGIGEALAIEFAKEGANLILAARNVTKLEELKSSLNVSGSILVQKCDVTSEEDCKALIDVTVKKLGGIDVLINNAGITMRGSFEDVNPDVLRQVMDVNFWGTVYCSQAAIPELLKTKGSLVAVSSVTGFKGLPGRTGYASSKFAVNGLFESIRMEYMNRGIHVLTACPGFTSTNIRFNALNENGKKQDESPTDENKMDSPKQVALDIMQAIRDRKDFMLTNKQGRIIFWLNKFFPRMLEKRIHNVIAKEPNSPIKS
ncbi:MAG: SDR family oxidoreductase [Bacteroidia bacterium]|nr:SDR family oxidoreductase [Bacteroidia bacterium]NNJ56409.1 SDR family oxidoreductase [Bacteroidia bacterium]